MALQIPVVFIIILVPLLLLFLVIGGEVHDASFDNITITITHVNLGSFGTPFFPDALSAASCIARRTTSRAAPSLSVTAFALMTAHYRPHRSLWGSFHRLWAMGKWLAPQGPTGCAPSAPLLVNTLYYGGGD